MKLGIVSDIHCNADALRSAIDQMGDIDELLCAGDMIYEFRFSNDVLDVLRERKARVVLGNHEWVMLGDHGRAIREAAPVNQDHVQFLRESPFRIETEVNGKNLLMVHGSPFEPWKTYVYRNSEHFLRLGELDYDYVIMGHTHSALTERVGRTLAINPGSAGEGQRSEEGVAVSYAVLDTASDEVRIERLLVPPPSR